MVFFSDGKDINSSDRILIGSYDLTVKKVDLQDAGIYTCHVFNTAGAALGMATVTVNSMYQSINFCPFLVRVFPDKNWLSISLDTEL